MRKFIVYVYYKKQYINAKRGLPQKRKSTTTFGIHSFLLTKEYSPREVALLIAIHRIAQVSLQAGEVLLLR